MKFVTDMNLSLDWIGFLRDRGHETLHWSAVGDRDAPDDDIASWARKNSAVIVTNDLDFGHLHAVEGTTSPSIVQIRAEDLRPESIGDTVSRAVMVTQHLLAAGAILSVGPAHVRVRRLPIAGSES